MSYCLFNFVTQNFKKDEIHVKHSLKNMAIKVEKRKYENMHTH